MKTTTQPATHTPGPWRTVPTTAKGAGSARLDIVSDGAAYSPSFVAGDILPEDAELIARAVNNYADLLAALEAVTALAYELAMKSPTLTPAVDRIIPQARAAISSAKG